MIDVLLLCARAATLVLLVLVLTCVLAGAVRVAGVLVCHVLAQIHRLDTRPETPQGGSDV
jgi:hypothetical protein